MESHLCTEGKNANIFPVKTFKSTCVCVLLLHFSCIYLVAKNINYYHTTNQLSELPCTIRKDLIYVTMKSFIGFHNEEIFINLLTPDVKTLIFETSILTDLMLKAIANKCKNLHRLLIPAHEQYRFTQNGLCNSINSLTNLQILQIVGSSEMNDDVLNVVSLNCKKLKCLYVNDCPNITDLCADSLRTMELVELNLANTKVRLRTLFC